jgi:hypothetical protein
MYMLYLLRIRLMKFSVREHKRDNVSDNSFQDLFSSFIDFKISCRDLGDKEPCKF